MAYNTLANTGRFPNLKTESPLTGAGQTWSYRSTDSAATVDTAGYISDGAFRGMKVGDIVEVTTITTAANVAGSAETGVTAVTFQIVLSANLVTGAVDLSDGTAISVVNTD